MNEATWIIARLAEMSTDEREIKFFTHLDDVVEVSYGSLTYEGRDLTDALVKLIYAETGAIYEEVDSK